MNVTMVIGLEIEKAAGVFLKTLRPLKNLVIYSRR